MADELNVLTPTPVASGDIVRVKLPHQAAIYQLAHFLGFPDVRHRRASGFTVHIPANDAAWMRFAIDGRRKDQFAVLAWLADRAHDAETEDLINLPPAPRLQVARHDEPVTAAPHRFTRENGTLSGRRLIPDDGYGVP